MNASVAVLTETWLTDGQSLDDDLADLEHGAGVGFLVRNRRPGIRGTCHGGVALAYRKEAVDMRNLQFDNDDDFEVVAGIGSMKGHSRKIIVVGAYLPPNYSLARGTAALDFISDLIMDLKRKYREPYIVLAGDFNQWDAAAAVDDFPDIVEAKVGPTRLDRSIDRTFCSFGAESFGTLEPLETDDGLKKSDHRVAYCLLYTSPSPRDRQKSRMPSSA